MSYRSSIRYGFQNEFCFPTYYTAAPMPLQATQNENFKQFLMNSANLNYQLANRSFSEFTSCSKTEIQLPLKQNGGPPSTTIYPKQRFTPYQSRYTASNVSNQIQTSSHCQYPITCLNKSAGSTASSASTSSNYEMNRSQQSITEYSLFPPLNRFNSVTSLASRSSASSTTSDEGNPVVLLISNLEQTTDENTLKYRVFQQLKPITPVISLAGECGNAVRVKVPSKQVIIV